MLRQKTQNNQKQNENTRRSGTENRCSVRGQLFQDVDVRRLPCQRTPIQSAAGSVSVTQSRRGVGAEMDAPAFRMPCEAPDKLKSALEICGYFCEMLCKLKNVFVSPQSAGKCCKNYKRSLRPLPSRPDQYPYTTWRDQHPYPTCHTTGSAGHRAKPCNARHRVSSEGLQLWIGAAPVDIHIVFGYLERR